MSNPDDSSTYKSIIDSIRYYKEDRGHFDYVQTPGIFECLNEVFGIENHLVYMMVFENDLREVYQCQAEWNRTFANNCIDLGVDMIHVLDDWGSPNTLMFNSQIWGKLIHPYHKIICDAVKRRNTYLSLHSDGNISQIIEGIIDLGYDVVHPYQESVGMDQLEFKNKYIDSFTIMGGLDVLTTLGFGKLDILTSEIERVINMFTDGGLLFCTTHFVQDHCSIDELIFAYDIVYELTHKLS